MNGLADIERHELRAVSPYGFYDDPSRLLRLVRFRVRLGFTVEERTQMQVANAREAEVEKTIPARALGEELKRIGAEDSPAEIVKALEEAGLLALFSPALAGAQARTCAGWPSSRRTCRMLPDDAASRAARLGPFLYALTEKLTPKEKQALIQATEMPKADIDAVAETGGALEEAGDGAALGAHPQGIAGVQIVSAAPPDEMLFLLYTPP